MKAAEARELATKERGRGLEGALFSLDVEIRNAAGQGVRDLRTKVPARLADECITHLEAEGFRVRRDHAYGAMAKRHGTWDDRCEHEHDWTWIIVTW